MGISWARGWALGGVFFTLAFAGAAAAQSGRQTTVDARQVLVNKDVAGLQWAIGLDPNDGTATGNVFNPDGSDPQFVWCERTGDDGNLDPSAVLIDFRCYGSDVCAQSPCRPEAWADLGQAQLPGSFFLPARDPFLPLQRPGSYCDPLVARPELIGGLPSFEVDTSFCNYLTLEQRTQVAIEPGDPIFVRLWHWPLTGPAPGQHRVALRIGERLVWSAVLNVPDVTGLLVPCITADFSAPAGELMHFHIDHVDLGTGSAASVDEAPPSIGRPMHSPPNAYNLIELNTGQCGEEQGVALARPDRWTIVSTGLPALPPR